MHFNVPTLTLCAYPRSPDLCALVLNPRCLDTKLVIMKTNIRELLNDRIDILNRKAIDASPARQVLKTTSAILTLVRVSTLVPRSPVDSHWQPTRTRQLVTKILYNCPSTVSTYVWYWRPQPRERVWTTSMNPGGWRSRIWKGVSIGPSSVRHQYQAISGS